MKDLTLAWKPGNYYHIAERGLVFHIKQGAGWGDFIDRVLGHCIWRYQLDKSNHTRFQIYTP